MIDVLICIDSNYRQFDPMFDHALIRLLANQYLINNGIEYTDQIEHSSQTHAPW